jgi:hypothetical protein
MTAINDRPSQWSSKGHPEIKCTSRWSKTFALLWFNCLSCMRPEWVLHWCEYLLLLFDYWNMMVTETFVPLILLVCEFLGVKVLLTLKPESIIHFFFRWPHASQVKYAVYSSSQIHKLGISMISGSVFRPIFTVNAVECFLMTLQRNPCMLAASGSIQSRPACTGANLTASIRHNEKWTVRYHLWEVQRHVVEL